MKWVCVRLVDFETRWNELIRDTISWLWGSITRDKLSWLWDEIRQVGF
jgi:hypothetical protein